ncbi:MAG TPA: HAMP domain-containing histidine kinase [Phycisphaerales bacterium]|nr:HAMP domain-containing histidine kinase [Phycisphaerales bacterium]
MELSVRDFSLRVFWVGLFVFAASYYLVEHRWMPLEMGLLFALGFLAEWRSVKLPGFGVLNPGEGFYLAASCLYGPLAGALLAFLSGLFWDLKKGKRHEVILFNVGWALMTFSLAGLAFTVGGLLGATLVYRLVSGSLQAHGEKHFSNLPLQETVNHQVKETFLVTPAVLLMCYFSMTLLELQAGAVLLLALPVELVYMYVKTRELSAQLRTTLRELESTQAELVATGRKAALGVMAAGIAHEINNPLAAAVTNIHMLKMLVHNSSAKKSMGLLEKSVERCQDIVSRMLKYSRKTESGSGVPCLLPEIVEDAVLFCGRKFGPEGVELKLELQGCPVVSGDPTEVVQIVSNLLANGHDAGGSCVTVGFQAADGVVELTVEDDGEGIPKELQTRIFEPFYTTKAVGSGTGLGLSIAQGLARGMGGDLKLSNSRRGKTVFVLRMTEF